MSDCVVCGSRYVGVSRPRYVLDVVGHVIGTAHTSCHEKTHWMRQGGMTPWIGRNAKTERAAQMDFYLNEVVFGTPWSIAFLALTETEQELVKTLEHWKNGPMKASDEWILAVQHDYQNLVSDFEAWRSSIE